MELPLLTLASASPRRTALLTQAAIPHAVRPVQVNEDDINLSHDPRATALSRAEEKAQAALPAEGSTLILAADTRVIVGDHPLDKANSRREAESMLRSLSGRDHEVVTGLVIRESVHPYRTERELVTTRVLFSELSERELAWYLDTEEWHDVAGAYRIQGLASRFIRGVQGIYSNVVGLPIAAVYSMVCRFL